jgi:hypothetical protein
MTGPGLAERAGGANDQVAVAVKLSLHQVRQLPKGDAHADSSFLP